MVIWHHPTDRIAHTTTFGTPFVDHWLEREKAQWVHPIKDRSDDPSHLERTLLPLSYISCFGHRVTIAFLMLALGTKRYTVIVCVYLFGCNGVDCLLLVILSLSLSLSLSLVVSADSDLPHGGGVRSATCPTSRFQMDAILTDFSRYDIPAPAAIPANLHGELSRYASLVVVVGRLNRSKSHPFEIERWDTSRTYSPTLWKVAVGRNVAIAGIRLCWPSQTIGSRAGR